MPSEFEPCGLNQIYSMAYGTLPIERGRWLKDSVNDYDVDPCDATGFVFYEPTPRALLLTMLSVAVVCAKPDGSAKSTTACNAKDFAGGRPQNRIYNSIVQR